MKLARAAVIDSTAKSRRALAAALKKAGLKVSKAETAEQCGPEQLVVFGPTEKKASHDAQVIKHKSPSVLVLAAQRGTKKPAWADAVLPIPISPADLIARLPELARLVEGPPVALAEGQGIVDPLTGFYHFAHFKEMLYVEVKRARRYGFPLAGCLIALDPHDITSDTSAALMGGVALAVRRSLRDTDYPVQYSADRVLVLMPHTDLAGAIVVAKRIVDRVGHATLAEGDKVIKPTVSIGVAASPAGGKGEFSFADLAHNAQESLTEAMRNGGNRVEFHDGVGAVP